MQTIKKAFLENVFGDFDPHNLISLWLNYRKYLRKISLKSSHCFGHFHVHKIFQSSLCDLDL